jgi:hypothetical protein
VYAFRCTLIAIKAIYSRGVDIEGNNIEPMKGNTLIGSFLLSAMRVVSCTKTGSGNNPGAGGLDMESAKIA